MLATTTFAKTVGPDWPNIHNTLISVSLQCAVSRRELRYVQLMRTRLRAGERLQAVRPIEHMWDLIADHDGAATATPDVGAAHGPGRRGGARARAARQQPA